MPAPLLLFMGIGVVAGVKAGLGLINGAADMKQTHDLTTSKGRDASQMKGYVGQRSFVFEESELEALARCKSEIACSDIFDKAEERATAIAPMLALSGQGTE